jgi:guanylate kinase
MSLNLTAWQRPDRGALFVVTGASGTGKTTLVHEALRVIPEMGWSVSATTRPIRNGEEDGVDYHFVGDAMFDALVADDELLEWAHVYGNRYGTPRAPVVQSMARGRSILLEIDVQGAAQVRAAMPEAVTVFILPPSLDAIEARLRARKTDSDEVIARRMADAQLQLQGCGDFDYLVENHTLASAHDQFQAVLVAELLRKSRRSSLAQRFVR